MRMRKMKNLEPRMERCADFRIGSPAARKGCWRELKPDAKALWVEVGCGKGKFTAETAQANPDVLLIAVERCREAMVVAMEKARDMGLTNVFFVDADAAILPELFAPGEVDLIYINFCDPWPPKRHAKRRLTHRNFLLLYRQVLKEAGQIHFKTDNAPLFEFSVLEFPAAGYRLEEVTRDLHGEGIQGIMTDYEEKFHNLGTKINRCVAIKDELPPEPEQEEPAEE